MTKARLGDRLHLFMWSGCLASFKIVLCFQCGINAKPIFAIVYNFLALLKVEFREFLVVALIGEYVFKFHLKCWAFFNKYISVHLCLSRLSVVAKCQRRCQERE